MLCQVTVFLHNPICIFQYEVIFHSSIPCCFSRPDTCLHTHMQIIMSPLTAASGLHCRLSAGRVGLLILENPKKSSAEFNRVLSSERNEFIQITPTLCSKSVFKSGEQKVKNIGATIKFKQSQTNFCQSRIEHGRRGN